MGWLDLLSLNQNKQPGMLNGAMMPEQQSGQPGIFGSIGGNTLMALGAGLASGRDWGEGIGKGLQYAMAGKQADQQTQTQNLTLQALMKRGIDPETARAAVVNPVLLQSILAQMAPKSGVNINGRLVDPTTGKLIADYSGGETSDIKEYQFAKSQGFDGSFEQWIQRKRAGAGEYGLSPVWGRDADGNPVMMQAGKSGEAIRSKIPEGVTLSAKEPLKMDAGTHFVLMDPLTRQTIGIIPKDIAGATSQQEIGKGRGEATASLESIRSKMPGLESVVTKLGDLSEKATYTLGGQVLDAGRRELGMEPREAAIARAEYESIVSNQILPLLRDTFGAQFTEREGATLRATLGNPDKSPKEKQAVLKAFIEQKRRDVEALERRTGTQPTVPAAAPVTQPKSSGQTSSGIKWSVE